MTVCASSHAPLEYLHDVDERIHTAVACQSPEARECLVHILKGQGKRFRPLLVWLCASCGGKAPEHVVSVAAAAELVHTASLVHDDVIDDASQRRGRAAAHQLWGERSAVLLGDFLFACAFRLLVETGQYDAVKWFSAAIGDMCQSEIEQARCLFELEPDAATYLRRIGMKTASLIEACCRAGAYLSTSEEPYVSALAAFGRHLGLAYQVTDDLMDFLSTDTAAGKPVARDFRRGVITLPIIYLMERQKERECIQLMLERRHVTDDEWREVSEWLVQTGALDRAQEFARQQSDKACRALNCLPPGDEREALELLCLALVQRER